MKITNLETSVVHIPLQKTVFIGKRKLSYRDHVIVKVHTDAGYVGYGYTFGYGAAKVINLTIHELLKPVILDKDPIDTEKLWYEMYNTNWQVGRRGILVRSLSAVDIALWDIKAKAANMPLYKLLGGYKQRVPMYTSGGYYREDEDLDDLKQEMKAYIKRGYGAVKMRIGMVSIEKDLERIRVAKEALGEDVKLMLDAELIWEDANTAIKAIRAFEKNYDIYWVEGPVSLDRLKLHAKIARSVETPIATGGQSYTKWEFMNLINAEAIDILQPDAIVCGGITEWLKIAHIADAFDLKVSPHGNWNIHAHLVAAVQNSLFVEYFEAEREVKVLDKIIKDPVTPDEDGMISPPERPGVGIIFDEEKIEEYRVE